jgi:hypothetical protein
MTNETNEPKPDKVIEMSDDKPVDKQRQASAQDFKPAQAAVVIEQPKEPALEGADKLNHRKLRSFVRRELTPIEVKAKQEKEYQLSRKDKTKHDFILMHKTPNRNANPKQLRPPGEGAYSPTAPCIEVLFIYDASTSLQQIMKKEKRGDFIVDFNFTDKCIEDAANDDRIGEIVGYVDKELLPKKVIMEKIGVREKLAKYDKSGKATKVEITQDTIDELYDNAVLG